MFPTEGLRRSLAGIAASLALTAAGADWLPVTCQAFQTVGLHDHPGDIERYEPVVFFENAFTLSENAMFMTRLLDTEEGAEQTTLYVTLETHEEAFEFECRGVRGWADKEGFSCVNNPPSEMLLIDPKSLRFTRSSIGGWTFYSASDRDAGASLFVEYGNCKRGAAGLDVKGGDRVPP